MVTDQPKALRVKHPFDVSSRQEDIPSTEKIARLLETEACNAVSSIREALMKELEDCDPQHNTLEKRVKRLERDVKTLDTELEILKDCADTDTVVDLIQEMIPLLVRDKSLIKNNPSSESSEESDSVERIVEINGRQVRVKRAIPHALVPSAKQRRRARPRKVKRMVA
jgi:predicted nuclease with TOPRIM domain